METPRMNVQLLDQLVAAHAGQVTDRPQRRPDPEVPERARRRTFTAKYKLEVLAAYDAAPAGECRPDRDQASESSSPVVRLITALPTVAPSD